jgi:tetratricopeptide (TPR) repeat protein
MNQFAAQSIGPIASRSTLGYTTVESKITSVHKLAVCYHTQRKYDQAERLYLSALASLHGPTGEEDLEFGQLLNNLARLYHTQGKYEKAEPLYMQSLKAVEQQFGEANSKVARRLVNLAELYYAMGRNEESMAHYQRAIAVLEQTLGTTRATTEKSRKALNNILQSISQKRGVPPIGSIGTLEFQSAALHADGIGHK